MTYKILEPCPETYLDQLMELYQREWWSENRRKEDVRELLQTTTFTFGLVHEEADILCGFTRVLSDMRYKAVVFDVIVHPDYRGQGLGAKLVGHVIAHPGIRDIEDIELYCKPEHRPFYEKFGFHSANSKLHFMRIHNG